MINHKTIIKLHNYELTSTFREYLSQRLDCCSQTPSHKWTGLGYILQYHICMHLALIFVTVLIKKCLVFALQVCTQQSGMFDKYEKRLNDQSSLLIKLKEEYEEKYSKVKEHVEGKIMFT